MLGMGTAPGEPVLAKGLMYSTSDFGFERDELVPGLRFACEGRRDRSRSCTEDVRSLLVVNLLSNSVRISFRMVADAPDDDAPLVWVAFSPSRALTAVKPDGDDEMVRRSPLVCDEPCGKSPMRPSLEYRGLTTSSATVASASRLFRMAFRRFLSR